MGSAATTGMPSSIPKRKQASVVEMLEYVKGLNIDPIREADMLWIAEEAFNAPLPPGWSEHQDEQGRVYFHNGSSGESTWKHPMDDLFREIVDYQRRVVEVGGFWQIEDEIAEQEENIRKDLADWMELFAEDGEKFFYNRHTEESRFDDPRMAVYHVLYARIKMVAKMKERFPILARQPRPEEPTDAEKELRRKRDEEQEQYMNSVVKIQTWGRVMLAKRKMAMAREQAIVQKGPQPLRGMLRLRMERVRPGGAKELVLSQTTPHKRHRAAIKIQKRMRGILTRKRFRPLVKHRLYLSKVMTKIQAMARIWLARRKVARKKQERLHTAATKIQRVWRGCRDRQYVSSLAAEKERYKCLLRSAITIQSGVRMALSKREVNRRKLIRYAMGISTIQRQARIFLLRKELYEKSLTLQPVQVVFSLNREKQSSKMLPWSWQVFMAPWEDEDPGAEEKPEAEKKTNFVDIFKKVGVSNWEVMAIVHCQRLARGHLARIRTTRLKKIARSAVEGMVEFSLKEVDRRKAAAITIQRHTRGYSVRRRNLIFEKRNAALESNIDSIKSVQAFVKRFLAQGYLHIGITNNVKMFAATMIQTEWRAWLARRHVERLREEALWPIKGWFEYTATGRDTVQVEVCFLANPSFDDYKYFVKNGSTSALQLSLEELEADLASAMSTIQGNQFLRDDVGPRKASGSKAPSRLNPSKDPRSEGSKASQKPTSAQRRSKDDVKKESRLPESAAEEPAAAQAPSAKSKAKNERPAGEPGSEEAKPKSASRPASQPRDKKGTGGEGAAESADSSPTPKPGSRGASPSKKEKSEAGAKEEAAAKSKASSRKPGKADADKTAQADKGGTEASAGPPKPDDAQPRPPAMDPHGSAREMSQSTQANELRASQSAPALEKKDAGKNYAGVVRNGKFERKKVDTVEALSKEEREAILADMEEEKKKKMQAIADKMKQQVKRKKKQQQDEESRKRAQMEEVEALEEERRRQKVKELKNWLRQKEEQDRAKKERDAAMVLQMQEEEVQKAEQQKLLEQQRQEQRDRRLQAVAKQKAKLEAQLRASREAAQQEKLNASQREQPEGAQQDGTGVPEEEPRVRKIHLQKQTGKEQMAYPTHAPGPGVGQAAAQRIVHRHIHHHVHYHEGEGDAPLPSVEEQRRIEQSSEDRVKRQLEEQGLPPGVELPSVDPTAPTPTMQYARSAPALHGQQNGMDITKTQEAFRPNQLPPVDAKEIGRKHGVPNFGHSVDRAIQSYADSGRPRFVKQAR